MKSRGVEVAQGLQGLSRRYLLSTMGPSDAHRGPPSLFGGKTEAIATGHKHLDCPPNQRKWLERRLEQAATMRPHYYCLTCGKVKNIDGPRARKLGFYFSGLSALKQVLEGSAKYEKMTQSQSRLITKAMEGLAEFEDSYGMSLEGQMRLYLEVVKKVRPELDDELVLSLLPKMRKRSRRPLIEMMTRASAG